MINNSLLINDLTKVDSTILPEKLSTLIDRCIQKFKEEFSN